MSIELQEGTVAFERRGSIIHVTLKGWITEELTMQVQSSVEKELSADGKSSILYDCLGMSDPTMALVLVMQSFHDRLHQRVAKSAIVVPGYRLAFLSRIAFGQDDTKYKVFYNNRDEALAWLNQ